MSSVVNQKVFLLTMVLAVPLLVGLSGMVSFLLLRMGYSFVVWALLPFLGLLLLVAVMGITLSWAARKVSRGAGSDNKTNEEDTKITRNGV